MENVKESKVQQANVRDVRFVGTKPTQCKYSVAVTPLPSKQLSRVRVSLLAPTADYCREVIFWIRGANTVRRKVVDFVWHRIYVVFTDATNALAQGWKVPWLHKKEYAFVSEVDGCGVAMLTN